MRYLLVPVAAVAATMFSTPALAEDNRWYAGGDLGVVLPRNPELDITDANTGAEFDNAFDVEYGTGYEIAGFAGYDLGWFKAEGEFSFKHAGADAVDPSQAWINFLQSRIPGGVIIAPDDIELDAGTDIISVMANGLVDIGPDDGFGGYIGAGVGMGWAKTYGESDGSFAWQLIAGVRYPISESIDMGLKYKYFDMSSLDYISGVDVQGSVFNTNIDGNWRSHSILVDFEFEL
jgi:opacity protein-like surface antigen